MLYHDQTQNKENTKIKKVNLIVINVKIMISNLWSEDQEGIVKIYGEGPRECSENIHQCCMYLALTACVL